MKKSHLIKGLVSLIVILSGSLALGQTSTGLYKIPASCYDEGGGKRDAGLYAMTNDAIGQGITGRASGTIWTISAGIIPLVVLKGKFTLISSISHNATAPLGIGDMLTVIMKGEAGGMATFTVADMATTTMTETSPGTYTGIYTVQAGDNIINGTVTGYLTIDTTTYTKEATPTVTFDTTKPILEVYSGSDAPIYRKGTDNTIIYYTYTELNPATITLTITSGTTKATETTITNLTGGTQTGSIIVYWDGASEGTYTIYGTLTDKVGNKGYGSDTNSIIIDNTKPTIPTLTSVVNSAEDGKLNLIWTPCTDTNLAGYKIHYGTQSGTYTQLIDTGSIATTYTLGSLTNGTCYYIAISAYDRAGNEGDSSNEGIGTPTGSLASIKIEVATTTITTDETLTICLKGYDLANNLIGDISGTFSITPNLGTFNPTYGTKTIFNPEKVGIGTVTATDGQHTDSITIRVESGALSYFDIPQPQTATTNIPFTLSLVAKDKYGNTATTFSGTATLTNTTNSISPTQVFLQSGSWTGIATITQSPNGGWDIITATIDIIQGTSSILVLFPKDTQESVIQYINEGKGTATATGEFSEDFWIRIDDASNTGTLTSLDGKIGIGIEITAGTPTPISGNLPKPIFVEIPFDATRLGSIDRNTLKLYIYQGGKWDLVPSSGVYPTKDYIWGTITHLTLFGIAGNILATKDLDNVIVYPNPCYTSRGQQLHFKRLTAQCTIKVFNIVGELVKEIEHNNGTDEEVWTNPREVASGIYIYLIKNEQGQKAIGKLGIIK